MSDLLTLDQLFLIIAVASTIAAAAVSVSTFFVYRIYDLLQTKGGQDWEGFIRAADLEEIDESIPGLPVAPSLQFLLHTITCSLRAVLAASIQQRDALRGFADSGGPTLDQREPAEPI